VGHPDHYGCLQIVSNTALYGREMKDVCYLQRKSRRSPGSEVFTGTTVLRSGQVLCYDPTATKTDADHKLRLGSAVQVISAANKLLPAGVVSDSSAGMTRPRFRRTLVAAER